MPATCDNLPYPLIACECCGFEVPFTRNFYWLSKSYIKSHFREIVLYPDYETDEEETVDTVSCNCFPNCPICRPEAVDQDKYGLVWVGERYYTPEEFIVEALEMGVSKAIGKFPKDLVLGKTWVLLAHKKAMMYNGFDKSGLALEEPVLGPAIFYAFVPQRLEMLIWASEATEEKIKELEEQNITPIIVPDGDTAHARD